MAEKLSAEQRKKVAEACGRSIACFEPDEIATHFRDLVTKTAQLIDALPEDKCSEEDKKIAYWVRLGKALATGNTDDIERLCYELLTNIPMSTGGGE